MKNPKTTFLGWACILISAGLVFFGKATYTEISPLFMTGLIGFAAGDAKK